MSSASRTHGRLKKTTTPQKSDTFPSLGRVYGFIIIAILAAVPFCLGKYFELNYPDPFDSGGYVYSARHILEGARIGIEEIPSAKPGTLLVNMLGVWLFGFSETGPKLIQALLQLTALILMFVTMRKLFSTLAAAAGVIIAAVYLSAPLIAKFGNVKEQYLTAFMVIGISCFILYQLSNKWWQAMLAGAFLSWAPLFKETGTSAAAAVGLFLILQPVFKHRTVKQTINDILLLLAGAVMAMAPLYVWIIAYDVQMSLPYSLIFKLLQKIFILSGASAQAGFYVTKSRQLSPFSEQWPRVLRYYILLILPISLAASSIIARPVRMILKRHNKYLETKSYDRFVLLLGIWWILDMSYVWISPRSYEQYYLPLNASAAMLGGYIVTLYSDALSKSINKPKWILIGLAGLACTIFMCWQIFFGTKKSPHSGAEYPEKRRGYVQKFREISLRRHQNAMGYWERIGLYIRQNSRPEDKIYVWGWFPGIYVTAQRFSPAPQAFISEMHVMSPEKLSETVTDLLAAFEKEPPRFIVDSRKNHFPWNRPPLELWPQTPKGFLPPDQRIVERYDAAYEKMLRDHIGEDEALRYKAMKPFRNFVMNNYNIVPIPSGEHVLFELKNKTNPNE